MPFEPPPSDRSGLLQASPSFLASAIFFGTGLEGSKDVIEGAMLSGVPTKLSYTRLRAKYWGRRSKKPGPIKPAHAMPAAIMEIFGR